MCYRRVKVIKAARCDGAPYLTLGELTGPVLSLPAAAVLVSWLFAPPENAAWRQDSKPPHSLFQKGAL